LIELRSAANKNIPASVTLGKLARFGGAFGRIEFDPGRSLFVLQICVQPYGGLFVFDVVEQIAKALND
jgi:hypothetical protein